MVDAGPTSLFQEEAIMLEEGAEDIETEVETGCLSEFDTVTEVDDDGWGLADVEADYDEDLPSSQNKRKRRRKRAELKRQRARREARSANMIVGVAGLDVGRGIEDVRRADVEPMEDTEEGMLSNGFFDKFVLGPTANELTPSVGMNDANFEGGISELVLEGRSTEVTAETILQELFPEGGGLGLGVVPNVEVVTAEGGIGELGLEGDVLELFAPVGAENSNLESREGGRGLEGGSTEVTAETILQELFPEGGGLGLGVVPNVEVVTAEGGIGELGLEGDVLELFAPVGAENSNLEIREGGRGLEGESTEVTAESILRELFPEGGGEGLGVVANVEVVTAQTAVVGTPEDGEGADTKCGLRGSTSKARRKQRNKKNKSKWTSEMKEEWRRERKEKRKERRKMERQSTTSAPTAPSTSKPSLLGLLEKELDDKNRKIKKERRERKREEKSLCSLPSTWDAIKVLRREKPEMTKKWRRDHPKEWEKAKRETRLLLERQISHQTPLFPTGQKIFARVKANSSRAFKKNGKRGRSQWTENPNSKRWKMNYDNACGELIVESRNRFLDLVEIEDD